MFRVTGYAAHVDRLWEKFLERFSKSQDRSEPYMVSVIWPIRAKRSFWKVEAIVPEFDQIWVSYDLTNQNREKFLEAPRFMTSIARFSPIIKGRERRIFVISGGNGRDWRVSLHSYWPRARNGRDSRVTLHFYSVRTTTRSLLFLLNCLPCLS